MNTVNDVVQWLNKITCRPHLVDSQMARVGKNPPANAGDRRDVGSSLGQEDPLEKEMATHSSILAWRIPEREEPSGLQCIGLQSQTWLSD